MNKLPLVNLPATNAPQESYERRLSIKLNEFLGKVRVSFNKVLEGYKVTISKTATYTANLGDLVILCDPTVLGFTVTLPDATTNVNKEYVVKKTDAGANAVTVATAAGNIDGAATQSLSSAYAKIHVVSDGANYWSI